MGRRLMGCLGCKYLVIRWRKGCALCLLSKKAPPLKWIISRYLAFKGKALMDNTHKAIALR